MCTHKAPTLDLITVQGNGFLSATWSNSTKSYALDGALQAVDPSTTSSIKLPS